MSIIGHIPNNSTKPYLVLAVLNACAFGNSLGNEFVWDDYGLLVYNQNVDLPLKDIPAPFTKSLWESAGVREVTNTYDRPVLSLFIALNYKIWGPNPLGFHVVTILLHIVTAMIAFRIGMLLSGNDMAASLLAASLFAVHPIHNESIGRALARRRRRGILRGAEDRRPGGERAVRAWTAGASRDAR